MKDHEVGQMPLKNLGSSEKNNPGNGSYNIGW